MSTLPEKLQKVEQVCHSSKLHLGKLLVEKFDLQNPKDLETFNTIQSSVDEEISKIKDFVTKKMNEIRCDEHKVILNFSFNEEEELLKLRVKLRCPWKRITRTVWEHFSMKERGFYLKWNDMYLNGKDDDTVGQVNTKPSSIDNNTS